MKKFYTAILTLAVLGGGYVGAKAFETKVEVRQESAWFPVIDGEPAEQPDHSFDRETNCTTPLNQTCAELYELDAQGNPTNLIESVDGAYIQ